MATAHLTYLLICELSWESSTIAMESKRALESGGGGEDREVQREREISDVIYGRNSGPEVGEDTGRRDLWPSKIAQSRSASLLYEVLSTDRSHPTTASPHSKHRTLAHWSTPR
jgi:hypothetical protein